MERRFTHEVSWEEKGRHPVVGDNELRGSNNGTRALTRRLQASPVRDTIVVRSHSGIEDEGRRCSPKEEARAHREQVLEIGVDTAMVEQCS